VLLEISQGARFHGLYFERLGLKMGGDIEFYAISVTNNNSNKSQKPKFWNQKSVENVVVALEGLQFNSSMTNWDMLLVLLERSR
jgi:hypothetical protein